ncbi:hypothetical protein GCM10027169_02740 [Gordonia jinhuaensis]|uniref:Uncharacterized protein n=1 Tax=Gordonia jinhuaensis TaxID=1517702 RepID=A0A916WTM5_9ACTN|nr:hypothetical protein [Gordonia jinhuaensis]GGB28792.1 hypothetical protein GCM10011489_16280 [Gordonia jinhuaensis]
MHYSRDHHPIDRHTPTDGLPARLRGYGEAMCFHRAIRTATRVGLVAAVGGGALALSACGDDSTASAPATSTAAAPATSAATTTDAPGAPSAAPDRDDATTVAGPRLPPATSIPASRQSPTIAGRRCGEAGGPEGALRVVIVEGTATCAQVMPVARAFGPRIALARNETVDGWQCGPSETVGVLANCSRGDDTFGFVSQ